MKHILPAVLLLLSVLSLKGQNTDLRRQIDIDRRNIAFNSQEAFEKSREYIREDSTYYIGYMYMGAYLFNRANDELGYRQAITWLQKAFDLVQRDYDKELRTRTNDLVEYLAVNVVQNDYCYVAEWLQGAYQNIEEAQKAYEVLINVKDHDLQYESSVESWNTLAWLYHRNRMYTSERFPFLRNSVKENDSMAYACLDSAIEKINRDNEMNQGLFDPQFLGAKYYYTYHYKVILFTYDFQMDSADYYYDILLQSGYYSSNNYANYQYMKGEFGVAEQFYKEAEQRDNTIDKHTREYYYMRGLLEVYRGTPERADSLLTSIISKDGFTPGYGWHSIALARSLLYEGLTTVSQRKLNNAARFQELHIGTTWGQEQYNLSVAVLNYINALHFEGEFYFENNQWWFWFWPPNWYHAIEYKIKIHHFRLIMVSLVAANPEREAVIYPLFSSENLLGWDETWQMLDGFSNKYFIKEYERMLDTDPRPGVQDYIRFMLARLYISDGDDDKAKEQLDAIMVDMSGTHLDFDNLLHARTCESLSGLSDGDESQEWSLDAYDIYPQLVPFSGQKINFHVTVDGEEFMPSVKDQVFRIAVFTFAGIVLLTGLYIAARWYFRMRHSPKWIYLSAGSVGAIAMIIILVNIMGRDNLSARDRVMEGFTECNVGLTDSQYAPQADFTFTTQDSLLNVDYIVRDTEGRTVNTGTITVDNDKPAQAGIVLAYRLFKIDFTYSSAEDVNAEDVGDGSGAAGGAAISGDGNK